MPSAPKSSGMARRKACSSACLLYTSAKTRAVKESIETGLDVALTVPLLAAAVEDEYRETRDSMADVDPEQWSRINGMDPIRRIRTAE